MRARSQRVPDHGLGRLSLLCISGPLPPGSVWSAADARSRRRGGGWSGAVRTLGGRAPCRSAGPGLRRTHADVADADAAGHAAAIRLGGDVALGARRPRLDRCLVACLRRAAGGADPAAEVPAVLRLVPGHLRARRRPPRRGAPGPGGRRAANHDVRRGRGGRAAGRDRRRRHPLPPRAAALRRGDGRPHRVRDRPPRLRPLRGRPGRRGRRRPGRPGGGGARPPGRRRGRAGRPLAAALVHRPGAVHAARPAAAAPVPGGLSRRGLRPAAAEPARDPPGPVRRAPCPRAPARGGAHPARRRLALGALGDRRPRRGDRGRRRAARRAQRRHRSASR